jgi:hypothetical protein
MRKLIKLLNAIREQPEPKYGWGIFEQQTWLEKQVDEAIYRRSFRVD